MSAIRTWLGLWACALAVGLAPPLRADEPKPQAKELAWVPSDSVGFVHVRFAELWNSPVGKNVEKLLNALDPNTLLHFEQEFGLSSARIDHVTFAFSSLGERNLFSTAALRITTTKPFDRRDVLAGRAFGVPKSPPTDRDTIPLGSSGVLHFTDQRTLTFVPEKDGVIALLGGLLSQSKSGALRPALELAAEKNHVVLAFDVTKFPRIPPDQTPPEMKPLRPLLDAKTATLIGNLREEIATLELRLVFGSKEDAADGKQALEEGVKLLHKFLDENERDLSRSKDEHKVQLETLKEVRASLAGVKIEQMESTVQATAQVKVAQILSRVLADGATLIRASADKVTSQNNLKQLNLALINYADTYQGVMAAAAITDKAGKPLLSWRVTILPYIEQDQLYKQFKLDEPWDSDHNVKLIQLMPKTYMLPGDKRKHEYPSTYYQAFVGPGTGFEPKKPIRFPASFPDGTSNTIWLAEAADPVPWTKPDDIAYDPKKMPKIGFHYNNRCNVGFADGSVRALKKTLDEKIWHLLIQRDDGQVIPNYDD